VSCFPALEARAFLQLRARWPLSPHLKRRRLGCFSRLILTCVTRIFLLTQRMSIGYVFDTDAREIRCEYVYDTLCGVSDYFIQFESRIRFPIHPDTLRIRLQFDLDTCWMRF
jgi:hypothetical protein